MNITVINHKYSFLFNLPKDFTPGKFELDKMSVTFMPKKADAFTLKEITAGWMIGPEMGKFEAEKVDNNGLVIRASIGYLAMSRMMNEFTLGCLIISNLINAMVFEAYRYKKHHMDEFKTLTFNRPGQTNDFFRELEANGGYELRLYVEFNNNESNLTQSGV